MMTSIAVNFPEAIQSRLAVGRVPRFGPLLMLVARPVLALLTYGITLLFFTQLKIPNASILVRNWWSVYGTLIDFGCLALLFWLTRRENIRLLDLSLLRKTNSRRIFLSG